MNKHEGLRTFHYLVRQAFQCRHSDDGVRATIWAYGVRKATCWHCRFFMYFSYTLGTGGGRLQIAIASG
jgi:hypothetical protein